MAASSTPSVSATTSPTPPGPSFQPISFIRTAGDNPTRPSKTPSSQTPSITETATTSAVNTKAEDPPRRYDVRSANLAEPTQPESSHTNRNTHLATHSESPRLDCAGAIDSSVRNPVPSNLYGRVDGRNGKFAVMHMGLTRPDLDERSLAAQRSSENTAAVSRAANKDGYRPLKRTRFVPNSFQHNWLPPTSGSLPASASASDPPDGSSTAPHTTQYPSPTIPPKFEHMPPVSAPPPPPPPSPPALPPALPPARTGLLSPETKAEQARLLTLLRSLHPVLVVDQLCKAIAYFGGIPSAPAPADGVFPESAFSNGSGSLFISWVAEIFPPLDDYGEPSNSSKAVAIPPIGGVGSLPVNVHRGRGRPKGSKGTKYQRKKGRVASSGEPFTASSVTDPANTLNAADSSQPGAVVQAHLTEQGAGPAVITPVRRGRGRPKGSKNKPKPQHTAAFGGSNVQLNPAVVSASQSPAVDSPLAHKSSNRLAQVDAANAVGAGTGLPVTAPNMTQQVTQLAVSSQFSARDDLTGSRTPNSANQVIQTPATQVSQISTTQGVQIPSPVVGSDSARSPYSSRKRKYPPNSQMSNEELQGIINHSHIPTATSTTATTRASLPQSQPPKRRRTSQNTSSNFAGPQPSTTGTPASPNILANARPKSPTTTRIGIRQPMQETQQQSQGQIQSHNASPQQPYQAQMSPQVSSQTPTQMSPQATNWQRNQPPRPQQRSQNTRNTQAYFQQQQRPMANQYGQNGNTSDRYGRNTSTGQFQQAMLNPSPSGLANQQPSRQQQQQQPQNQQQQPAPSSQSMNQYQGYADSSYMNMDYPSTNFSGQTQLEAAMAAPNMRENIYQAITRR